MSDADYDAEHGYGEDDYAEMLKEWTVYCYWCRRKVGIVVGGKFPPRERRLCGKCQAKQRAAENPMSGEEKKRRYQARKMSHEEAAIRRGEYAHQRAYVRCPRWVIERMMAALPPEVQDEIAVEVRTALQSPDPLPGDPLVNPLDPWNTKRPR